MPVRKTRYTGVFRRCESTCAESCRRHKFAYIVELGVRPDGKRDQPTKGGFETAEDARDARAEVLRKHRAGTLPTNRKQTVGEYLDAWLAMKEANGLARSTLKSYGDNSRLYLKPHLGSVKLAELRPQHVNAMMTRIAEERPNLKASSRDSIIRTLRTALTSALKAGEVERNVAKLAEKPKRDRKRIQVWEPQLFFQFEEYAAGKPFAEVWHVGAFAGLRRGELCGLRWIDCDLDNGVIVVRQQITAVNYATETSKPKTFAGEDRIVHIDADTVAVLRKLKQRQRADKLAHGAAWENSAGLVFTAEAGKPIHPERLTKTFARYVKRAGLPHMRLHDLRHLSASIQIAAGVPIAVVSKRLGHSSIQVTVDTYGHLFAAAGEQAAEATAAFMRKARGL